MPPVEAPQPAADPQPEPESIAKPLVGIIYPPPEVRSILLFVLCCFVAYFLI